MDFKNISPTNASNVTLVIKVLNSAGIVVGSQSWPGQNVARDQTLNETYGWTAAPAGTYPVEGLVLDSSGKTLQQARVGTITVNWLVIQPVYLLVVPVSVRLSFTDIVGGHCSPFPPAGTVSLSRERRLARPPKRSVRFHLLLQGASGT